MKKVASSFIVLSLLLGLVIVACSPVSQPDVLRPTSEVDSASNPPPITTIDGATQFAPGDPTATPPGEQTADPNYQQGKAAYEAENYEAVLVLMEKVLQVNPDLAPPHWYRGMAHFYLGDYQAGLSEMEQALALDPNYALGYADRGLMYSMLGNDDRAMPDWQKALELDPSLAKVHHNIGNAYYRRGEYGRALEEYEVALAIDSTRAKTWWVRSRTLLDIGRYQECIESADWAVALDPELWIAYHERGTCRTGIGEYGTGKSDLEIYIREKPDDPSGWYNLGAVYQYLGDLQKSIDHYSRAIELDPTFAWALINRGHVYIGLTEYELAMADNNAALALGEIPAAYVGRGDAHYGLRNYDEALADYKRATELLPAYADAWTRLGRVYVTQGQHQEAIEAIDRALSLDPDEATVAASLEARGRAYYGLGDYEQAIEDFSKAMEFPSKVGIYYNRGVAYQANGQVEEAIRDLEHFLTLASGQGMETYVKDAQARLAELRE